jgi:hypothetical protein
MSDMLSKREAMVSKGARLKLKQRGLDNGTSLSLEAGKLVAAYGRNDLTMADDPGTEDLVRIRFAIDADDWRRARSRAFEEDVSISSVVRRAVAAL